MHKIPLACLLFGLIAAQPPLLRAEVNASVSSTAINQNEPVTLTLESDSATASPPDLAPLDQDFYILNRRSSRSMRSFNGRTTRRTSITLTLMPKRGGDLTIPAIGFGQERSQSIRLSVRPTAASDSSAGSPPGQGFSSLGPGIPPSFGPPQQNYTQGYPMATPPLGGQDWTGMTEAPPWGGFPGWGGTGFGMPDWTGAPAGQGWLAQP